MPDLHYDHPSLAELYDVQCGWSEDRDFYLSLAGPAPQSILDLGCGTGLLCNAYAVGGHAVTGADPSPAMLDIAHASPRGTDIEWVAATAESFRAGRRFDLIIMTGHTFQVLLEDRDIAAALTTIHDHLKPNGRAVFESRNPALDWIAKWDHGAETFDFRGTPIHYTRRVVGRAGERLTFEQSYTLPSDTLTSTSTLRFPPRATIERLAHNAGLTIELTAGDWRDGPFNPASSEEMIFTARIAGLA